MANNDNTLQISFRSILMIGAIVLALDATAQQSFTVAKYRGDCQAAISYTFDDGLLEQYTVLFPQLKKRGLKASFCVNANTIDQQDLATLDAVMMGTASDSVWQGIHDDKIKPRMTWEMMREMAADGQEITSHGFAHKNVTKLNDEELRYELEHNDTLIYEHIGIFPRTFFYPGNAKNEHAVAVAEKGRIGTRTFQVSLGSKRDAKWMKEWVQDLLAKGEWGVTMTHGLNWGYDHFADVNLLWQHFDEVCQMQDELWIDTFRAVSAYVKERENLRFEEKVKGRNISILPVMTLDKELFDEPLTLVFEKPISQAKQDGKSLKIERKNDKYLVDVLPSGGRIKVKQ